MVPTRWFHAVNTESALQKVCLALTLPKDETKSVSEESRAAIDWSCIAVEVDIRLDGSGRPILQHDPHPPPEPEVPLRLEAIGSLLTTVNRRADSPIPQYRSVQVLKLDFKERGAIRPSLCELHALLTTGVQGVTKSIDVWINADIHHGPGGTANTFTSTPFLEIVSSDILATPLGAQLFEQHTLALSLGWTTGGFGGRYTEPQCSEMLKTVDSLLSMKLPEKSKGWAAITFPVRVSFVVGDSTEAPLKGLLDQCKQLAASRGLETQFFLTFWRGRTETVSQSELEWINANFPGSTVDTD
jgi:hypothetical protein